MTIEQEEAKDLVLKMAGFLDKAKIPFCLTASTLLGIYRDGGPIGNIFEFDVLAKEIDVEGKVIARINEQYPTLGKRDSDTGLAIIDFDGLYNNSFELQLVYTHKDYAFKNLTGNECLVWPKYMYDKFDKFTWEGREWNVPHDVEKWLEVYYGKDWRTPRSWVWTSAPNHCVLQDIKEGKFKFNIDLLDKKE